MFIWFICHKMSVFLWNIMIFASDMIHKTFASVELLSEPLASCGLSKPISPEVGDVLPSMTTPEIFTVNWINAQFTPGHCKHYLYTTKQRVCVQWSCLLCTLWSVIITCFHAWNWNLYINASWVIRSDLPAVYANKRVNIFCFQTPKGSSRI